MELENHTFTHNGLYNASDELLAKEGKYYELWNMQQGIFRKKAEAPKPVAAAVVEEDDDGESMTY